ncbi:probable disease resistance protein RXW24L isoform X2 [Setaria italica]|uniref:probable disease resistance protein RXW24L isoform X2 n=1 Tax=Setaria italica TaxID=4555 RepID=UPI000350CE1E|nr:probable disease resistance protein RXW24L isoform X2 [Setaria italica]
MADLVLGLAKTTVEGTVSMARAAMEEEEKLKKSVQRDLLVISDEFEMMHAFLEDAKDHVTDNVTRTLVRQVRKTALDVEDCIEAIIYLDNKPHWWHRMMLPWCMPPAAPGKDLDAAVAYIEQLKARVEAMGHRNLRYKRIGDCCHKPAEHQHAVATSAAKQSSQVDLIMSINGRNTNESRQMKGGAEGGKSHQGNSNDDEKEEEKDEIEEAVGGEIEVGNKKEDAGNESKVEQEVDDVQLKVISVLGTGGDLDMMFINKAYDDPETRKNFKCRAWVKLEHPLNPSEFIRSLLAQFHKNICPEKHNTFHQKEKEDNTFHQKQKEKDNTVNFLELMVATDGVLIQMFKAQIRKKYLVVLEDVSTMVDWETVRGYLPDNKNGSCVVVHTRHPGIACSCVGHGDRVSELEKLSVDHSVHVLLKEDVAGKSTCSKTEPYEEWEKKNPLFGREEDLRWLSWLTDEDARVVPVWGISGVGKSFLVKHFCRKVQEEEYHRDRNFIWLNVSRPFDLRDLSRSLFSDLLSSSPEGHMMPTIKDPIQRCHEFLLGQKNSKYFIVIDGLQSIEEWDSIRPAFKSTTGSSIRDNVVIIIVTNEESVANHCATDKNLVRNVKGLEVRYAIELFNRVVTKNEEYDWKWNENREEIMHRNEQTRDILVQKCGGLPKVICAVAESWRMVRDIEVKDNLVSKLEANAPLTTQSLEGTFSWLLSYFRSCPDYLKPCIFYLTIFPVNHTIRRTRLVRRWIAEGYSRDNKENTAEENGESSFSKIVNLSMIQAPRTKVDYMRMSLCQVNGFLREYIVSQLMEENLVFALEGHCKKNIQRTGRHLAIDNSWDRDKNVFESIDLSLLRSLTVFGKWETFIISDRMRLLRVLDLEDVSSGVTNGDVEKMVKLLPRLKFLSLRGCREISRLPDSLGDLKQLQTLDIRETSVIKLPKSIIKLEKLQYIRAGTAKHHQASEAAENPSVAAAENPSAAAPISRPCATLGSKLTIHRRHGSHSGIKVPRGIGKLSSLHTLGVVNIHASGEDGILEELKNLTQLHKLGVSGINRKNSEKFFSDISRLVHLESLSLKMQANQDNEAAGLMADISSPLEKLRSLKLYGLVDRLPSWIMQMCLQLPRLEKVDLQMKTLPQQELDFILTLPYLCSLRLRLAEFQGGELRFGWSIAQSSGEWIIDFLEIACNSRLQAVKFGSKVYIEILKIRCSSVSSSLQFYGLRSMSSLKEVLLSGSYDHAFEQHLERELKENKNGPILKPEQPSSST